MKATPYVVVLCLLLLADPCLSRPLPLDAVANMTSRAWREGTELSPNGEWLAHTVDKADAVYSRNERSSTLVNLSEGISRREAQLIHVKTGETLRLAPEGSLSWAPRWSPDGTKVAFFSDQSGQAAVWIWDAKTRTSRQIPGVVPWTNFSFETPEWHPDSRRLVVPALTPQTIEQWTDQSSHENGGVEVRTPGRHEPKDFHWTRVALVQINVDTGGGERLTEPLYIRRAAFSPDGRHLAYTHFRSFVPGTYQNLFPLHLIELKSKHDRVLAMDLKMHYGTEWSWSPNGQKIGFVHNRLDGGKLSVIDVETSGLKQLSAADDPNLEWTYGENPPLWAHDGVSLIKGDGKRIYSYHSETGRRTTLAEASDVSFRGFMAPRKGRSFTKPGLWAVADQGGQKSIWRVEPGAPPQKIATLPENCSSDFYDLAVTPREQILVYYTFGLSNPGERETVDLQGHRRKLTDFNPGLSQFGQAKLITWTTDDGTELDGTLLLPPAHDGSPLPTVFWVYAGAQGSSGLGRYGIGDYPVFNFHTLATRGYAVFYPSIPYGEGRVMADVNAVVQSAADALVEQGYSDPDRLAIMGQSFGTFTTLCVLVQSDRFKAAVVTAGGDPNLFSRYSRGPTYVVSGQGKMGGTPWTHFDRYLANSPFFRFDKITTPLLIGHGTEDSPEWAEATYRSLEQLGKDVELRLYDGENHVISSPKNVVDFWERRLEFFETHLGP